MIRCLYMLECFQTHSNSFKRVQTRSNMFECVQTRPNVFVVHSLSTVAKLLLLDSLYLRDILFQSAKISPLKKILCSRFVYFDQAFVAWFTFFNYSNQPKYLLWNFVFCSEFVYLALKHLHSRGKIKPLSMYIVGAKVSP